MRNPFPFPVGYIVHPPYGTIAEFRAEAVLPPAESGRISGGVVLTSRSVTSVFHGNALLPGATTRTADITRQGESAGLYGFPGSTTSAIGRSSLETTRA